MSLEHHAFLQKSRVPLRAEWQAAIDKLGFDLQLHSDLKPFEDSGFVPCRLNGNESGFEIYYEPADELMSAYPEMKQRVRGKDFAISFRWGGDLSECACVMIASAALAESFHASVYFPQDDCFFSTEQLCAEAKLALQEVSTSLDERQHHGLPSVGVFQRLWLRLTGGLR